MRTAAAAAAAAAAGPKQPTAELPVTALSVPGVQVAWTGGRDEKAGRNSGGCYCHRAKGPVLTGVRGAMPFVHIRRRARLASAVCARTDAADPGQRENKPAAGAGAGTGAAAAAAAAVGNGVPGEGRTCGVHPRDRGRA
jgi:hypothetical protein